MHIQTLDAWEHNHDFAVIHGKGERRTNYVLIMTAVTILQDRHGHPHESNNHHYDHNLKAAYLHVLADALTSVPAIVALLFGKMFGWNWLDPIMGIVGALVITRWSLSLLKETSPILLDETIEENKKLLIKATVESDSDNRICDLHVWKVGPNDYAAVVSLVTHFPKPVEHYKGLLSGIHNLSHITIEINQCMSEPCIAPKTGVV
jgi:cation diffusion facilitator family transporter